MIPASRAAERLTLQSQVLCLERQQDFLHTGVYSLAVSSVRPVRYARGIRAFSPCTPFVNFDHAASYTFAIIVLQGN